jgi:hypothetical protein
LDVPYNFDEYLIQKKLNQMVESGWEIGLHASMNAYESVDRFLSEKHSLESVLPGYRVRGVRHHYWRLGENTNRSHTFHYESGFEYDSSLGLNDEIGFRSGTMWPFEISLSAGEEVGQFFEIPPTLMDGNIFYYNDSVESYFNIIKDHFNYVKTYQGCVVLDWHLEQANVTRLNGAGRILELFLLQEVQSNSVFVVSPEKLLDWWKQRRQLIKSLK